MNKQKIDLITIIPTVQKTMNKVEIKQTKGLKRNTIDKYYTNDVVVELCLNLVKKYIKITSEDLIIEPSAGNGSFIEKIKSLTF